MGNKPTRDELLALVRCLAADADMVIRAYGPGTQATTQWVLWNTIKKYRTLCYGMWVNERTQTINLRAGDPDASLELEGACDG